MSLVKCLIIWGRVENTVCTVVGCCVAVRTIIVGGSVQDVELLTNDKLIVKNYPSV